MNGFACCHVRQAGIKKDLTLYSIFGGRNGDGVAIIPPPIESLQLDS